MNQGTHTMHSKVCITCFSRHDLQSHSGGSCNRAQALPRVGAIRGPWWVIGISLLLLACGPGGEKDPSNGIPVINPLPMAPDATLIRYTVPSSETPGADIIGLPGAVVGEGEVTLVSSKETVRIQSTADGRLCSLRGRVQRRDGVPSFRDIAPNYGFPARPRSTRPRTRFCRWLCRIDRWVCSRSRRGPTGRHGCGSQSTQRCRCCGRGRAIRRQVMGHCPHCRRPRRPSSRLRGRSAAERSVLDPRGLRTRLCPIPNLLPWGSSALLMAGPLIADRYHLIRPLALGGQADVYLARDTRPATWWRPNVCSARLTNTRFASSSPC